LRIEGEIVTEEFEKSARGMSPLDMLREALTEEELLLSSFRIIGKRVLKKGLKVSQTG
jgi:hypothetical protein